MAGEPDSPKRNWILTGSQENFRIYVERDFDVIGLKERRRRLAELIEPGDEVFFYVTGVQAFGAIAPIRSPMFEDRAEIWPPGPKGEELAFQGQLREIGEPDARLLHTAMP